MTKAHRHIKTQTDKDMLTLAKCYCMNIRGSDRTIEIVIYTCLGKIKYF
jgi:hypothetical protein